jgi:hypothetical protein
MKKLLLPIACCLVAFACNAQTPEPVSISVDPKFMLSASFKGSDDGDWFHKITQVKMMILDKTNATLSRDLHNQRFEDLFSVRKGGDLLQLMSRQGRAGLRDIAFLAGGKDGGLYFRFSGKFTQQDLDKMAASLQEKNTNEQ